MLLNPVPGVYFYVYFSGCLLAINICTSYPMPSMWEKPPEDARHKRTTNFSFVISLEAKLSDHSRKL